MMNYPAYIAVDKPVGETPLQTLERVRVISSIPADIPMTYAGRLDPMASGVLLILIGEECKRKDDYTSLDKEYEFEVLFGCSSDTGDVMGLIGVAETTVIVSDVALQDVAKRLVGKHNLAYPAYSSQPVMGKPMFAWAREGKLGEIEVPLREMEVMRAEYVNSISTRFDTVVEDVVSRVGSVSGDFRQDAIVSNWKGVGKNFGQQQCQIVKFRVVCGSGTYVRVLVGEIGKWLGAPTLAYSIRRTRVGAHTLTTCTNI